MFPAHKKLQPLRADILDMLTARFHDDDIAGTIAARLTIEGQRDAPLHDHRPDREIVGMRVIVATGFQRLDAAFSYPSRASPASNSVVSTIVA